MKFLFLYTEIADYFLACCEELSKHGEVHVVRWPVNKEAPFQFQNQQNIKIYNRNDYKHTDTKSSANKKEEENTVVSSKEAGDWSY